MDLREQTWQPSDTFPNIDWIIGNHSDELSPWIAVVASKSSYNCKYFLLPCCAFEFSGKKFSERCKDKSLYMSYMDFLMRISNDVCGFKDTLIDRLKIPSTKRICLIGYHRSYPSSNFNEQCKTIDDFVRESSDDKFIPRDKIEPVKNCTRIDKNVIDRIVKIIFDQLLSQVKNIVDGEWNKGGELSIADTAKLISTEDLNMLKSECGGLQTLFKNKGNIFEVHGGKIKLRKPKCVAEYLRINENKRRRKMKATFKPKMFPCYFYLNHPQRCPLSNDDCLYQH